MTTHAHSPKCDMGRLVFHKFLTIEMADVAKNHQQ